MNISKENVDELNAIIKIRLSPEDYTDQYQDVIRKYQKNANLRGFRPGKVPIDIIKKMYGKAVLVDELNKILVNSLDKYIAENNIEIIGNPIPKADAHKEIDWDNTTEFEFLYELGLAPQFDLSFSPEESFVNYTIKVDEDLIEKYVNDLRRRYGKFSNPETSGLGDILYGDLEEVDDNSNPIENGLKNTTAIAIDLIKDEDIQKQLLGLKKEDELVFNLAKALDNTTELAAVLGITKDKAAEVNSNFKLHVKTINKVEKAELNQEFFDKIYGPSVVTDELGFRDKVKEEIVRIFDTDSERKLKADMVERMLSKFNLSLPDEFLKKWLMAANEKPLTKEQVDKEYENYAKSLRWRLIENKILKDYHLHITDDEIKEYAKKLVRNQFANYGHAGVDEEKINEVAERYLKENHEAHKIKDSIAEEKVFDLLKSNFKIETQEMPYDEFIKLLRT